jgi:cysteine desulfurase
MGMSLEQATSTLRLSLGHETTDSDIDYVIEHLPPIVERSRARRLAPAS